MVYHQYHFARTFLALTFTIGFTVTLSSWPNWFCHVARIRRSIHLVHINPAGNADWVMQMIIPLISSPARGNGLAQSWSCSPFSTQAPLRVSWNKGNILRAIYPASCHECIYRSFSRHFVDAIADANGVFLSFFGPDLRPNWLLLFVNWCQLSFISPISAKREASVYLEWRDVITCPSSSILVDFFQPHLIHTVSTDKNQSKANEWRAAKNFEPVRDTRSDIGQQDPGQLIRW